MKNLRASLLLACAIAGSVGCTSSRAASDGAPSDTSDLVGVPDLVAIETALGLEHDFPDASGTYARPQEKLAAGACYQRLGGNPRLIMNRYKNGAVFFPKKGSSPMDSGDRRSIWCVDLDLGGPNPSTIELSRFTLDTVLRYNLGKPMGLGEAGGQTAFSCERGALKLRSPEEYCKPFSPAMVPRDLRTSEHAVQIFQSAYWDCLDQGTSQDACLARANASCVYEVAYDAKVSTIDQPSLFDAYYVIEMAAPELSPAQAMVAYAYATQKANESDVYSLADDPIGRFVSAESQGQGAAQWQVARFERLDVHRLVTVTGADAQEGLYVTPKSSDRNVAGSALAKCTRSVSIAGDRLTPTSAFACSGLP
jgi:hypothetical protein